MRSIRAPADGYQHHSACLGRGSPAQDVHESSSPTATNASSTPTDARACVASAGRGPSAGQSPPRGAAPSRPSGGRVRREVSPAPAPAASPCVSRDLLCPLERPPFDRLRRDPRRPERVAARRGREGRGRRTPLDHRQHEPPIERPAPSAAAPPGRRSGRAPPRLLEPARLDVGVEGRSGPVVGRDSRAASRPSRAASTGPGSPAQSSPAAASPTPRSPARSCRASPTGAPGPGARPGRPGRSTRGASLPPPARGPASTRQSPSMRTAAKCCFTVGTDPGWVRM